MEKRKQQFINGAEFKEFLNREFGRTAVGATIEELADFAFGGLDEAVKAFEGLKGQNDEDFISRARFSDSDEE
jgi:hypothetical protein